MKNKKVRAVISIGMQIIVTAVLFYTVAFQLDIPKILQIFQQAISPFLIILIILFFLSRYIYALQVHLELSGYGIKTTLHRLVKVYLITTFYSLIIPGDLVSGGVTWYKLGKDTRAWSESGMTIVYLRILHTLLLFIIGIAAVLLDPCFSNSRFRFLFIIAILVFLSVLICFLSNRFFSFLTSILEYLSKKFKQKISRTEFIDTVVVLFRKFPQMARTNFLRNLLFSSLLHIVNIASIIIAAAALGIELPFIVAFWLSPVMILFSMLPFAFGGIGVREGLFLILLSPYQLSNTDKIALSLLLYAVTFVFGGLFGAVLELHDTRFRNYKNV